MDRSLSESSSALKNPNDFQNNPRNIVCLQQNLFLPSNLLQKRKNIIEQFRKLKSTKQSKTLTPRQPATLMSKTFCHSQNVRRKDENKVEILIEESIENRKESSSSKKRVRNPLYRRISDIQSESKELKGVSFSKLLSRMEVIDINPKDQRKKFSDYRKKNHPIMDSRNSSITDFHCIESKLFTIQCPEIKYQSARTSPSKNINETTFNKKGSSTNRLFKRYFNPHGQKSDKMSEYESIQFDEKYIYRNGKKSQCKRIHNFYTSCMFKKNYDKHMRNTIDILYTPEKQ